MNQNDKIKYEKFGMTHNQLQELRSFLVERIVDNMSTKDLVEYVTNDLDQYYENMSDVEFIDEAKNYWDDGYDEVVEDIKEYTDCDFKRDRRDDFLDSLSEGKDLTPFQEELEVKKFIRDNDDYGSKVDALVDSMSVTVEEESTTHRRRDLDSL